MFDALRKLFSSREAPGGAASPPTIRAPYALPRGVPALQQDPDALRRRLLFGIAFAALLAGGSGYMVGRGGRDRDPRPPERRGAKAR